MSKNHMSHKKAGPEWASGKQVRETHGFNATQLRRYSDAGLIRTSNIVRPGTKRGIRLFSVPDIDALINASVERGAKVVANEASQGGEQ